jgi:hypothetical protein
MSKVVVFLKWLIKWLIKAEVIKWLLDEFGDKIIDLIIALLKRIRDWFRRERRFVSNGQAV